MNILNNKVKLILASYIGFSLFNEEAASKFINKSNDDTDFLLKSIPTVISLCNLTSLEKHRLEITLSLLKCSYYRMF